MPNLHICGFRTGKAHRRLWEKRIMLPHLLSGLMLLALFLLLPAGAAAAPADAIVGVWTVEDGSGKIEIFPCGEKYCGKIVWQKEPAYSADDPKGMGGKPLVDRENPNPALRCRPQLGMTMMEGYGWRGGELWAGGKIYNPDTGKSYKSRLKLLRGDRLELRAFIGISLLGGSTVWTRDREWKKRR